MHRLVNHVVGAPAASSPSRIRPASAVHALEPIAQTTARERALPTLLPTPYAADTGRGSATAGRSLTNAPTASQFGPPSPDTSTLPLDPSRLEPHDMRPIGDSAPTVSAASANPRADADLRHEGSAIAPPQRLLEEVAPRVAQSPIVPARIHSDLSSRADRARDAGQSTEVHVHIGRIEVTATHEPSASKKTRAPTRPAVPLSQYLARRRS